MKNKSKVNYRESFLYSGVGQLLDQMMRIIVTAIIVRIISRELYGVYGVLVSAAAVIGSLTTWGWTSVFNRYIPQLKRDKDYALITSLIVKGVVTRSFITILTLSAVLFFFDGVGGFFNIGAYYDYFLLYSIGILSTVLFNIFRTITNAHFDHKQTYRTLLSVNLIKNVASIIAVVLGYGLAGIILVESIAMTTLAILMGRFIWQSIIDKQYLKKLPPIPQKIKVFNLFSFFNDTGLFLLGTSIDTFVIVRYLGPEAVAIYSLAAMVPKRVKQILPTVLLRNVLQPMFFTQYADNRNDTYLNNMFNFLTKLNFAMLIPIFITFVFFGHEIIILIFSENYLDIYPYMIGLAFFFFGQLSVTGYVIQAIEKMHISALSKILSVYNLFMSIVLIQIWGLAGVVIATGSANLLKEIYMIFHIKRHVQLTYPLKEFFLLTIWSTLVVGSVKAVAISLSLHFGLSVLLGILLTPFFYLGVLKMPYFSTWDHGILQVLLEKLAKRSKWVRKILNKTAVLP